VVGGEAASGEEGRGGHRQLGEASGSTFQPSRQDS